MIIEARIQATIEILTQVFQKKTPADQLITSYFRTRRYIGGGDRRDISKLVYGILRQYFYLSWTLGNNPTPRLLVFAYPDILPQLKDLKLGDKYAPEPLSPQEKSVLYRIPQLPPAPEDAKLNIPNWALSYLQESFPQSWENMAKSLNEEASFDLRVNTLKCKREDVLQALANDNIDAQPTPHSPWGIRLNQRRPLPTHPLWQQGWIDVQDEGSQLLAQTINAQPGETILDLCAGAGGKTLALAMMMENKGKIYATDVVKHRLERAKDRLKRASVHNAELKLLDSKGMKWLERQEGRFDRILIDAPCSGSGTWRRNPDLKLRFQPQDLNEILEVQKNLLDQSWPLLKTGGRLYYATCSIFTVENQHQTDHFLSQHQNASLMTSQQYTPLEHGCDGFYIAEIEKKSN